MKNARILFISLLLALPFFVLAQDAPNDDAAKEKLRRQTEFLEKILADGKILRLPENRAFVYAKVGNALWQTDEKRARELFQSAIGELLAAQSEAEAEKGNKQILQNLIYGQQPRWNILFLISSRDAEFALGAMHKTRPAKIAHAINALSVFAADDDYQSSVRQSARSEIQNEQRLLALAADQNTESAVKLVRESLKKTFSYESLNLLKKIGEKDSEAANKLAEEVAQTFLARNFEENYQSIEMLSYFLTEVGRERTTDGEKSLRISDKAIRDLADKMLQIWLDPEMKSFYGSGSLPIIEKMFPERAAQAKRKFDRVDEPNQTPQQKEYYKLLQSEASADEILTQAPKMPRAWRTELYRRAAEKLAQNGNIAQAQNILAENLPEEQVENYLSQFNYNLAQQAVSQEKYEEANAIIARIPSESLRLNALNYLAHTIFQKNPKENQKWATSVLDQARSLLDDSPENSQEMTMYFDLANSYALIGHPEQAFSLIEPLIAPLDELARANAVIAKFGNYGTYRQGEFQIAFGGQSAISVSGLENVLQILKNHDFERAVRIAENFSRPDTRLAIQLQLVADNITDLPINGRRMIFTTFSRKGDR